MFPIGHINFQRTALPFLVMSTKHPPATSAAATNEYDPEAFVAAVSEAFVSLANPERAVAMRAYMRDQFDFLGIPTPVRRSATRDLIRRYTVNLPAAVDALWQREHREFQYVGCDLLRAHQRKLTARDLPHFERWMTSRSWWDTVDGLVPSVGSIVRADPSQISHMKRWLEHESLWLRRAAILHQLGWKSETDPVRLFEFCLRRAGDSDFFIRKAIGWALRDYARHAPDAVAAFVARHAGELSPLSVREAAKHLDMTAAVE